MAGFSVPECACGQGMLLLDDFPTKIRMVRDRIRRAAERVGRDPGAVRLVAATKGVEAPRVLDAVHAGLTICGENRWQEAQAKMDAVGRHTPGQKPSPPSPLVKPRGRPGRTGRQGHAGVEWHFIGRLQRRKLRWLVGQFELIHSVESFEQAEEIQRRARERDMIQAILLEVNVGGEDSKGGFHPDECQEVAWAMDPFSHVSVRGLMTLPPWHPDPEHIRPYFQRLKRLADRIATMPLEQVRMDELSMGMSHDCEIAVEEGATLVRVGTAIFGARPQPPIAG